MLGPEPHARVEVGVGDVDEEVGDDEDDRDQHHDALHHREVAGGDRLQREEADAGPVEDQLDDEGAAEDEADLQPDARSRAGSPRS